MSTQFIYQPHIHADGMTITPDLPLSRLSIVTGAGVFAAPVRRIVTDQVAQYAPLGTQVFPAAILVAASEGTLIAPGALVAPGGVEPEAGRMAASEVLVSRQCWRMKNVSGETSVQFEGDARLSIDPARAIAAAFGGDGRSMAYGWIVVAVAGKGIPAGPGRKRVILSDATGRLAHGFDLEAVSIGAPA